MKNNPITSADPIRKQALAGFRILWRHQAAAGGARSHVSAAYASCTRRSYLALPTAWANPVRSCPRYPPSPKPRIVLSSALGGSRLPRIPNPTDQVWPGRRARL